MTYRSFEELEVWQKACQLAVKIYMILRDSRDYGLKDQMTRAGVSIASNIAEGSERDSAADFRRFLHIAKGSAAELRTQIYIAGKINVIQEDTQKELIAEAVSISKMLYALIKSINLKPKT